MGFLKLATVTKVQANACRHKALSWKYANRLETQLQAEVEQLMPRAAAGVDVPAELKRRENRRAAIRAAKAEIEPRAAVRHEEEEKIWREKMGRARRGKRRSGGKPPSPPRP